MRKCDESADPTSCWNRARENELLFILLARDAAAADTIRFWAARRVALGKNKADDQQIREALGLAALIEGGF